MGNSCAPSSNRVGDIALAVQPSRGFPSTSTQENNEQSPSTSQPRRQDEGYYQSMAEEGQDSNRITGSDMVDIGTSIQSLQWDRSRTPLHLFTSPAETTDRAQSVMTVVSVESHQNAGTTPIMSFHPIPVEMEDRALSAIGFADSVLPIASRRSSAKSVRHSDGYPSNNFEMVITVARELEDVFAKMGGSGLGLCEYCFCTAPQCAQVCSVLL